jgi:hypothetical protein
VSGRPDPVEGLLREAAHRGSTVLPVPVAEDVLRQRAAPPDAIAAALGRGAVVEVTWQGQPALALGELAEAEDMAADALLSVAGENRLAVVVGVGSGARRAAVESALGDGSALVLLDEANRVGIEQVVEALEDLPEDAVLVLAIDPALPLAGLPGAVALDLAASGICPVLRANDAPPASGTDRAAAAVAAGSYLGPSADRAVVEVVVASPEEAVRRVQQLVTDSIPRTFGTAPADVLVLTREETGPTCADALTAALAGATVAQELHEVPGSRADAAVVVLAGTRPVTRAEVYAALRAGARHVSLVIPTGVLLTEAVNRQDRPRRTRLALLLTT